MNILILLLIIITLLISFLYYKNYKFYSTNTKKVSWNNTNIIIPPNNISNIIEKYDQDISEFNPSSKITSYLDNLQNSYPNSINIDQPKTASIPTKPIDNFNFNDSRSIININNANTRVHEFNQLTTQSDNMTIGNLYDNLVDNYRVEWGKSLEGLDGNSLHDNHYNIDTAKPEDNGYTSFATY